MGNVGQDKFLNIAIGVIAIIIIIAIIVGLTRPDLLISLAFSLGIAHMPGEEDPEFQGEYVPQELQAYYDKIVSQIKNAQTETTTKCFFIGKSEVDWDNFRIVFNTDKLSIQKEKDNTLGYDPKAIEGFEPCFYYCDSKTECYPDTTKNYINKDSNVFPYLVKDTSGRICIYTLRKYRATIGGDWVEPIRKDHCE